MPGNVPIESPGAITGDRYDVQCRHCGQMLTNYSLTQLAGHIMRHNLDVHFKHQDGSDILPEDI